MATCSKLYLKASDQEETRARSQTQKLQDRSRRAEPEC